MPADTIVQTQSLCLFFLQTFSLLITPGHCSSPLHPGRLLSRLSFPKPPQLTPSTFCACYLREENCLSIMPVSPPSPALTQVWSHPLPKMTISITHNPSTSWMGKLRLDSMLTLEPRCLVSYESLKSRTDASEGENCSQQS